jgi:serine/threonine protein kinase
MALENGATFAGYTVRRLLGSGGMGEVYLVEHPRLPRLDAMKVLREAASANAEFRTRFEREANIAAGLWHPHIVGLHDRGEFDGRLWITMDFVDGTDAAQLVKHQHPTGLPLDLVVAIVKAVASALDYAHQRGLLHRDIKPANILLSDDTGVDRRILLSDFGIARQINEVSSLTATHLAIGTVSYSAPEQLMGGEIDGRADQYSLAATAFRLLTAQVPYQDSNQVAVISQHLSSPPPRVSGHHPWLAPLDDVLMKGMAKSADERFDSCTQFARAFERAAADVTEPVEPLKPAAPVEPPVVSAAIAPPAAVVPPVPAAPPTPTPVVPPIPVTTPPPVERSAPAAEPSESSAPSAPSVLPAPSVSSAPSAPAVTAPEPVHRTPPRPPAPTGPSQQSPPGQQSPPARPSSQRSAPESDSATSAPRHTRPPVEELHSPTVILPTVPPAPSPPQSRFTAPGPARPHGPRFEPAAPSPQLPRIAGPEIGRPVTKPKRRDNKPWLLGVGAVAVVAAVVGGGIAVFGGSDDENPAPSPETSSSASTTTTPSLKLSPPPPLVGTPGTYPTIATYLHEVSPNVAMTHRHDPGAPIITLPMPPNWYDAGAATRSFAYQTIIYRGPGSESYAPSVTALMSKLGPNVDPQKIIDFAPGELNNMPGFVASDPGGMRSIDGRQAYRLAGTWDAPAAAGTPDMPGVPAMQRLIAQYTVLIKDQDGLYVLQMNVDAAAGQNAAFQQICDAIDRDTKIATG